MSASHYHWYTSEFADPPQILHVYDTIFHGFFVILTSDQVASLSQHPAILHVFEDCRRQLHTTRSPQFLGLRNQKGKWSESNYGSDVIVRVFDTGVWLERWSFSNRNLGPVPKRWRGVYETGVKFTTRNCNKKLIGARFFIIGHEATTNADGPITAINGSVEWRRVGNWRGHFEVWGDL